jgi:hypothetical protein
MKHHEYFVLNGVGCFAKRSSPRSLKDPFRAFTKIDLHRAFPLCCRCRENSLTGLRQDRVEGGPFGFAQGKLFDCVAVRFANGNFAQDDR